MAKREETLVLKLKLESSGKNLKSIDDLIKRNEALRKTLKKAPLEGEEGFEELRASIDKATKEFRENQKEIVKFNKSLRVTAKDVEDFADDSLKGLSKRLREQEQEYKTLSKAQRQAAQGKDLQRSIKETREELFKAEKQLGDFRRQVGNYEKTLKGVGSTLRRVFVGRTIADGLRSIGGFLGDVIEKNKDTDTSIGGLADAFSDLRKTGEKLALGFLRFVAPALTTILNGAAKLAETLFGLKDVSNDATSALFDQAQKVNSLEKNILPLTERYEQLSKKTNISSKEQKELNEITNKIAKEIPGAAKQFDKYGNAVAISADKVKEFVRQQRNLLRAQNAKAIQEQEENLRILNEQLGNLQDLRGRVGNDGFLQAFNIKNIVATRGSVEEFSNEIEIVNDRISGTKALLESLSGGDLDKLIAEAGKFNDSGESGQKEQLNRLQALQQQQANLREQIQLLALAQKDSSKQAAELQKVNKQLEEAQKALNKAEQEELSILEQREQKRQELEQQIKISLENGEDVTQLTQDLVNVTLEMVGAEAKYAAVQKTVNEATRDYAQGSLTDLNDKISQLQEEQSKLVLGSVEYIQKQAEINVLEQQRTQTLELLKTKTDEFRLSQQLLKNSLDDATAENNLIKSAQDQIKALTGTAQQRAEQTKNIERQLQNDLLQIQRARLNNQDSDLQKEIERLRAQKELELTLAIGNEQKKEQVIAFFDAKINEARLQQLNIQKQLLNQDFEAVKENEAKKTTELSEQEKKRQEIRQQATQATFNFLNQASTGVFQIIENNRQQAFEAEQERLDKAQEAAERNLSRFVNSEKRRAEIQEEFDAKRDKLNKEAAKKQKTLALIQAAINTALAVTNALATVPFPGNIIAAAAAAAAGAVQIAVIASKKFQKGKAPKTKKASRGMVAKGRTHEQGGIPAIIGGQELAEIENNEAIVNARSTVKHYDLLSALNEDEGGIKFPGAKPLSVDLMKAIFGDDQKMITIARNGFAPRMPALQERKFREGGIAISSGGQKAVIEGKLFRKDDLDDLSDAVAKGAKQGIEQANISEQLDNQNEREATRSTEQFT